MPHPGQCPRPGWEGFGQPGLAGWVPARGTGDWVGYKVTSKPFRDGHVNSQGVASAHPISQAGFAYSHTRQTYHLPTLTTLSVRKGKT